jgi:hypothetical protein
MIESRIIVNDTISQYIQQQMEAAQLERQRQLKASQEEAARKLAKQKELSMKNSIRALGLLGIEAGERDLHYEEAWGYYLVFNNVRFVLCMSHGVNWLCEETHLPFHSVEFTLRVARIIPEEYFNEDGELGRGFFFGDYMRDHHFQLSSNGEAPQRVQNSDMTKIFSSIHAVEESFQSAVSHSNAIKQTPVVETVARPIEHRFTYTGDSREEILAHVLRDIQADYYPEVEF